MSLAIELVADKAMIEKALDGIERLVREAMEPGVTEADWRHSLNNARAIVAGLRAMVQA